jgi:hypothetical protein
MVVLGAKPCTRTGKSFFAVELKKKLARVADQFKLFNCSII